MTELTREPKHYVFENHLAKIFDSPEFAAAAKEVGRSVDAFRQDVEQELKKLTEEARKEHLRTYQKELSEQALIYAVAKFKGDVEGELKKLVARRRAEELSAFQDTLKKVAITAAKAKASAA
jgi:hypothetical protein